MAVAREPGRQALHRMAGSTSRDFSLAAFRYGFTDNRQAGGLISYPYLECVRAPPQICEGASVSNQTCWYGWGSHLVIIKLNCSHGGGGKIDTPIPYY
jgi:hypothetical protein